MAHTPQNCISFDDIMPTMFDSYAPKIECPKIEFSNNNLHNAFYQGIGVVLLRMTVNSQPRLLHC
jgi:hypothetical protein